ncbi:MAG: citrate/2-methylcitrate synthase [Thermoleophilia bacterium]|nr:citrate/2-methylcitrate synthase [Thermoleophilia bacterium]
MAGPKKSVQLSGVTVAQTAISSIEPDLGVLRYRGYDITDLAEHSTYEEVAYLLLEGDLPTSEQLDAFKEELSQREFPRALCPIIDDNARDASPMETLRTAVSALSFSDPAEAAIDRDSERRKAAQLIAQLPTILARYERIREGEQPVDPDATLSYAENFLTMLRGEAPTAEEVHAFDVAMILHAEHEMNASTFTARVVAGTDADMHSAIVAAICALKGPKHGAANLAAMEMMEEFGSVDHVAEGVRHRLEQRKPLYGFGHPLYRAMDPRAPILKELSAQFADVAGEPNWYEIACEAERQAQAQKGLWTNVDLFSGVLYRYLGIPNDLFPALFQCSRVAGQAAHVLEQHGDNKIIRPSAEYIGPEPREFPVRTA